MSQENNFNKSTYQNMPQMVLGFHGCDKSVVNKILTSGTKHLNPSTNDYDWLGEGIYFWLNDPRRAYEWAEVRSKRSGSKIKEPAVIGAVIDLGLCLNLCERESIVLLQKSYKELKYFFDFFGIDINEIKKNKAPDEGGFNLLRPLDCAVIENLHNFMEKKDISYDTVYGYFQEGADAYLGAGIKEKSHIQICVRNKNCIKGYFLPRLES